MLTGIVALNLLCLMVALVAIRRLTRVTLSADPGESFGRVLAAAEPVARRLLAGGGGAADGSGAGAPAAPGAIRGPTPGDKDLAVRGVRLGDRLIVLRHMLQRFPAGEAAEAAGLAPRQAEAAYRGRRQGRGRPC